MKIKFNEIFLIVAWVIFIASKRNAMSSIILMAAGLYELCYVVPKLRRWIRDARRKS